VPSERRLCRLTATIFYAMAAGLILGGCLLALTGPWYGACLIPAGALAVYLCIYADEALGMANAVPQPRRKEPA
jgi:4-hydroxybenzoate polyprenyltransferase